MDFDWNNPPFNMDPAISVGLIEQSFEDPFAVRLLPDSARFEAQARFFNLGMTAHGHGIFTVYRTNGKQARVIFARPFEPEEKFLYQKRLSHSLSQ